MRSEICKTCCPQGGALFDIEHYRWDDEAEDLIEDPRKVCRNCGAEKKLRKSKARPTYDEITETITTDNKLNLGDKLRFHYFNPNGALGQKRVLDAEIDAAIEAKIIKGGWALAHGWGNTYHKNALYALMNTKRPKGWSVNYHIAHMKSETEYGRVKLAEELA